MPETFDTDNSQEKNNNNPEIGFELERLEASNKTAENLTIAPEKQAHASLINAAKKHIEGVTDQDIQRINQAIEKNKQESTKLADLYYSNEKYKNMFIDQRKEKYVKKLDLIVKDVSTGGVKQSIDYVVYEIEQINNKITLADILLNNFILIRDYNKEIISDLLKKEEGKKLIEKAIGFHDDIEYNRSSYFEILIEVAIEDKEWMQNIMSKMINNNKCIESIFANIGLVSDLDTSDNKEWLNKLIKDASKKDPNAFFTNLSLIKNLGLNEDYIYNLGINAAEAEDSKIFWNIKEIYGLDSSKDKKWFKDLVEKKSKINEGAFFDVINEITKLDPAFQEWLKHLIEMKLDNNPSFLLFNFEEFITFDKTDDKQWLKKQIKSQYFRRTHHLFICMKGLFKIKAFPMIRKLAKEADPYCFETELNKFKEEIDIPSEELKNLEFILKETKERVAILKDLVQRNINQNAKLEGSSFSKIGVISGMLQDPSLRKILEIKDEYLPAEMTQKERNIMKTIICRNLWFKNKKISKKTVMKEYKIILETREVSKDIQIFKNRSILYVAHNEPTLNSKDSDEKSRFGKEKTINAIKDQGGILPANQSIKPGQDLESVKNAKERTLEQLVKCPSPMTFCFNGHGGPDAIYFAEGQDPSLKSSFDIKITVDEFVEALIKRYKSKEKLMPVFIGQSEYNQSGYSDFNDKYGSNFLSNTLGLANNEPSNLGTVIDADLTQKSSNPSVYIPSAKDLDNRDIFIFGSCFSSTFIRAVIDELQIEYPEMGGIMQLSEKNGETSVSMVA